MKLKSTKSPIFFPFFKEILCRESVILGFWILLATVATYKQYAHQSFNNFLIFKYTYLHASHGLNLYQSYPEYGDTNHYGPLFSLLFAPFAFLPTFLGMMAWQLSNAFILLTAVYKLPLNTTQKAGIAWICTHELLTSQFSFQSNAGIAGLIILTFICVENKKDFWAGLFIALGALIKLYGIVGLAFFFLSKNKTKFTLGFIFWLSILFCLPMLPFGYNYIIQSYQDWFHSLQEKNTLNAALNSYQDISVMGMARRISGNASLSNTWFILPAAGLLIYPYIQFKKLEQVSYRLLLLSSLLIFTVIFSSGAESPTYIIAFAGLAIWFSQESTNRLTVGLLIFALLLTSFSPSDLFPAYLREHYVRPYALKALPCFLIWGYIHYKLIFNNQNLANA
ncbi:MAG: glycosyltransferase family 87 protein [Sphingobacteriaceae bacterium]